MANDDVIAYDDNDKHSLALCAWKEARGQGLIGMRAVMCVIKNRVGKPGFAHTLHDVIYGKNQFTSMSVASDPEFNLEPSGPVWPGAQLLASQVLDESLPDNTNGAHYYANLDTMDKGGWFERNILGQPGTHPLTATIGAHSFYL
jgi:N-acetylmuramoyl-L-alanine amidase